MNRKLMAMMATLITAVAVVLAPAASATTQPNSVAALSPAVQSELAEVTASMSPTFAKIFAAEVVAAQSQIDQLTPARRAQIIQGAIRVAGLPPATAQMVVQDPVLFVSVPTRIKDRVSVHPDSDVFACGGPCPIHCAHSCPIYNGSTAPTLSEDYSSPAGVRLATVSFEHKWQYNGWGVTGAPAYAPPVLHTTNWCVNCSLETTFHNQNYYVFDDSYGHHLHGGYFMIVYFTVKSCWNFAVFQYCFTKYRQWEHKFHYDGGFLYNYNYKS